MGAVNTAIASKYQEIHIELYKKAETGVKRYKDSGMWLGPYVLIIYTFFFLCGVVYICWTVLSAILGQITDCSFITYYNKDK